MTRDLSGAQAIDPEVVIRGLRAAAATVSTDIERDEIQVLVELIEARGGVPDEEVRAKVLTVLTEADERETDLQGGYAEMRAKLEQVLAAVPASPEDAEIVQGVVSRQEEAVRAFDQWCQQLDAAAEEGQRGSVDAQQIRSLHEQLQQPSSN